MPIKHEISKHFVFADSSFANMKDMSSQMGFLIILGNEDMTKNSSFKICGNLIKWSSTKSKRVTRLMLAAEIYGMVSSIDMRYVIPGTINMIMDQLNLPAVPLIIYTDSCSLYECIVKLETTKEKHLRIDIMAL